MQIVFLYKHITFILKIFWLYYEGNDLKNLKSEYQNETLKKYLDDDFSQKLVSKQKEIDKFLLEVFFNRLDFEKKTYTYIKNKRQEERKFSYRYFEMGGRIYK